MYSICTHVHPNNCSNVVSKLDQTSADVGSCHISSWWI